MRRWLRYLGVLAYAALVVGVFGFSAYTAFNLFVRSGVTSVPELAGLTEDAANALAADQGLKLERAEPPTRASTSVEAGRVIESRPRAGSLVKRGSAVAVTLSLGPERHAVPDLGGKAVAAANVTARGEGFVLGSTLEIFSARGATGTIVGQEPMPGTAAAPGTPVDVLVATEPTPERYVMPDLVNRRFQPVRAALERAGFRFGAVNFEPYEGIASGVILRQSPEPGHPVSRQQAISLVVSGTGAEVTP